MTLTVRLPHGLEQKLAAYCVKHRVSKSAAVKRALENLLASAATGDNELSHPFVGGDKGKGADVSANIKAALRARFEARRR